MPAPPHPRVYGVSRHAILRAQRRLRKKVTCQMWKLIVEGCREGLWDVNTAKSRGKTTWYRIPPQQIGLEGVISPFYVVWRDGVIVTVIQGERYDDALEQCALKRGFEQACSRFLPDVSELVHQASKLRTRVGLAPLPQEFASLTEAIKMVSQTMEEFLEEGL